ncbi:VWA domain-containing protein [Nocardioides eburneiflavus]|uniref:VWA domain-containing protein n=1 Tax=Nocardioides eburneiflavus TaxID=2518372 RepID=A0A4Z1C518_9ACTN|nr:VWA domain-containing protein [Nocardioides eburneiflavus]TGN64272.1 VWA domain-containing protein [Nocardioides eburneiflavus]
MNAVLHEADEVLLGFTRALRAAGVPVTQDRAHGFLAAVAAVGADDRQATYWAGRATLCGSPDDLARHDEVFAAWFDPRDGLPRARPREASRPSTAQLLPDAEGAGGGDEAGEEDLVRARASEAEVLKHRDVATLDAAEKRRLASMFVRLSLRPPARRTARHQRWHRGELDASRTLRNSLRHLGEPGEIAWRRRGTRPRRVVLLVDVSGSMSPYADALLRLAHRLTQSARSVGGGVETFTVGTRLTHVTRALRSPDADRAIVAAGEVVPDWSGGTRLGETLRVFLDRWGQRGMARGAVVVVFSDGWERGDAELLGEQMARLKRVAHRVVWVNPHRGKAGYEPLQGGVVAALPHCDDFLAGHSLATFADLTEVISRA